MRRQVGLGDRRVLFRCRALRRSEQTVPGAGVVVTVEDQASRIRVIPLTAANSATAAVLKGTLCPRSLFMRPGKRLEWDEHLLEFIAIGTGVVHGDGHRGFRAHDGGPFTSDLSGQDFWCLLHSGYRPVEMVMGSCVYHVAHRGMLAGLASVGRNVELENYTSAMYEAREIAVERMQAEAAAANAEGVVGVDIHEGSHNWQRHVIEFFAIGTAVLPLAEEIAPEKIADPIMVLSVNDWESQCESFASEKEMTIAAARDAQHTAPCEAAAASNTRAASADRPNRLDPPVAHADVPVV